MKNDRIERNDVEDLEETSDNTPLINSENKPVEHKSISLTELKLSHEENIILILGSEGFGVSKDIMNSFINYNIYIPPQLDKNKINQHPFDIIDSLNVGVSAGIIINHIASHIKLNSFENKDVKNEDNRI